MTTEWRADVHTDYGSRVRADSPLPYFADPSLRQRLDLLHHLIEYADLLLVVKGPHGSGKTALLNQFATSQRDNSVLCRIDATPLTTRHQFLASFAGQLGLNIPQDSTELIERSLTDHLELQQQHNRVVLLAVDDAHALAAPILDLIVRLHDLRGKRGKLLRILLFAEAGLDEVLRSPALQALADRITHTLDVPPFAKEQTRAFLEHVMCHFDAGTKLPLAESVVADAHEKSGGLPGRLIAIAQEISTSETTAVATESSPSSVKWPTVPPRFWMAAGVVILVVIALVLQDEINRLFESETSTVVHTDRTGKKPLPLPRSTVEQPSDINRPAVPQGQLPKVEAEPPSEPVVEKPVPQSEASGTTESIDTMEPESQQSPTSRPEPEQPIADHDAPSTGDTEQSQEQAATVVRTDQEPSPAPLTKPLVPGVKGDEWILLQPKTHFTLQLFGVRQMEALREFVEDHDLADQVSAFETRFEGGPWFVLLYGTYPNRGEAETARDRLTAAIRNVKPWPRTFGSVHEQLQQGAN